VLFPRAADEAASPAGVAECGLASDDDTGRRISTSKKEASAAPGPSATTLGLIGCRYIRCRARAGLLPQRL
jgi:hypothetical protein